MESEANGSSRDMRQDTKHMHWLPPTRCIAGGAMNE